nr:vegetative cell wall protein gp1-like [Lolium perenne]
MRAGAHASPRRRRGLAGSRLARSRTRLLGRAGRRPGGLYIDEPTEAPAQAPHAQPEEDDDPEMHAALVVSREVNNLEELAKWPHLAEARSQPETSPTTPVVPFPYPRPLPPASSPSTATAAAPAAHGFLHRLIRWARHQGGSVPPPQPGSPAPVRPVSSPPSCPRSPVPAEPEAVAEPDPDTRPDTSPSPPPAAAPVAAGSASRRRGSSRRRRQQLPVAAAAVRGGPHQERAEAGGILIDPARSIQVLDGGYSFLLRTGL